MGTDHFLEAAADVTGLLESELVTLRDRRVRLVALRRFGEDHRLDDISRDIDGDADVVVVPFISRRDGLVDPGWLDTLLRTGTTLRDTPAAQPRLVTDRLVLRRFYLGDLAAMARLHLDAETMATLDGPLSSETLSNRVVQFADGGFERERPLGHYAVERTVDAATLGWVGFSALDVGVPLPSTVQIGWRFHRDYWGAGYASEAARAVIDHELARRPELPIVAITAEVNVRSRVLMDRLGLHQLPGVRFDHPLVAEGAPMRSHVAYATTL